MNAGHALLFLFAALDGVYLEGKNGDAPRFVPAMPPSRAELYALTERVALRVMASLRKRGHAKDDDHASNDTPKRTFAEVLANVATQRGSVENVKDDSGESEGPAEPAAPLVGEAVTSAAAMVRRRADGRTSATDGPLLGRRPVVAVVADDSADSPFPSCVRLPPRESPRRGLEPRPEGGCAGTF